MTATTKIREAMDAIERGRIALLDAAEDAADPETPLSDAQHRLGELRRMAESMVMSGNLTEQGCGRRFLAALGTAGGGQERTEGDARHG
jgi:hypothetical protein